MPDAMTHLPLVLIGLVAVLGIFAFRGREIPDWAVAVAATAGGGALLYVLADSPTGVLFATALLCIGALAWYRTWRGRADVSGTED